MDKLINVLYGHVTKDISVNVVNSWYQRYTKKDEHDWHTHADMDLAFVYYVELPNGANPTVFKTHTGKIIEPDVQEGEMIAFPGLISHCSPPNESNETKSIIAMNVEVR